MRRLLVGPHPNVGSVPGIYAASSCARLQAGGSPNNLRPLSPKSSASTPMGLLANPELSRRTEGRSAAERTKSPVFNRFLGCGAQTLVGVGV